MSHMYLYIQMQLSTQREDESEWYRERTFNRCGWTCRWRSLFVLNFGGALRVGAGPGS